MDLIALTKATAGVLQVAGQQHTIAAAALGEYTSIAQTGSTTGAKQQPSSTEIGVREMGERRQQKAKDSFRSWAKRGLAASVQSFQKLFGNLFYLGGMDSGGQRNQQQLAMAIRELNQALGSLSRGTATAFQVEDSHNVMIRRAKAHYFQAGAGIYMDGGPAAVFSAVSTVLRSHGFLIEADIAGVIGDSEVHRLANAYTLDAKKLSMFLRQSATISAKELKFIAGDATGSASIKVDGDTIELATGISSLKLTPEGIILTGPILQLLGVLQTPAINPATASPIAVPPTPIGGLSMATEALEDIAEQADIVSDGAAAPDAKATAVSAISALIGGALPAVDSLNPNTLAAQIPPVDATQERKPQKAMPQWKGHLPQPWV